PSSAASPATPSTTRASPPPSTAPAASVARNLTPVHQHVHEPLDIPDGGKQSRMPRHSLAGIPSVAIFDLTFHYIFPPAVPRHRVESRYQEAERRIVRHAVFIRVAERRSRDIRRVAMLQRVVRRMGHPQRTEHIPCLKHFQRHPRHPLHHRTQQHKSQVAVPPLPAHRIL